ncbi:MAG: response regulator [Gammaproteobacteria bacterium]
MEKYVLLVEDNEDDIELTLRAFKKYNHTTKIITVKNGEEALHYLINEKFQHCKNIPEMPDIILMDINMPKISGIELLKLIKENEKTKLIPVIMLTSSDEKDDIISSYALGASSYLRKPVDFHQFSALIKKVQLYWITNNITAT